MTSVNAGQRILWLIRTVNIEDDKMAGDWHVSARDDRIILSYWIKTLCAELELDTHAEALLILQDTFHAIRDNLPVDRAILLADRLPFILRSIYFAGWTPGATGHMSHSEGAFFDRICQKFGAAHSIASEEAFAAVLALLQRKLPAADGKDAEVLLPQDFLRSRVET